MHFRMKKLIGGFGMASVASAPSPPRTKIFLISCNWGRGLNEFVSYLVGKCEQLFVRGSWPLIHAMHFSHSHFSISTKWYNMQHISLADPSGHKGPPESKFFSFSCTFWGKLSIIIVWRPHLYGLCPLLWDILDPPLQALMCNNACFRANQQYSPSNNNQSTKLCILGQT